MADALARIREAILGQRYTLTEHAYLEMEADYLDVLDVEAAVLNGKLGDVLTDDPRGPRYVVLGTACDLETRVEVVARLVEEDRLLVITVYEVKEGERP